MTPSIQRVVEFAKRVPGTLLFFFQKYKLHFQFNACEFVLLGFPELSQDDQLILIKIGFFEVWLTHVSRLVNAQEMTLTLADGATLSKKQMELIFDVHSIIYIM